MNVREAKFLKRLQDLWELDAIELPRHARARLEERAFLWEDVAVVISSPAAVECQDEAEGRWRISGRTSLGESASLIMQLLEESARVVTLYWE